MLVNVQNQCMNNEKEYHVHLNISRRANMGGTINTKAPIEKFSDANGGPSRKGLARDDGGEMIWFL